MNPTYKVRPRIGMKTGYSLALSIYRHTNETIVINY